MRWLVFAVVSLIALSGCTESPAEEPVSSESEVPPVDETREDVVVYEEHDLTEGMAEESWRIEVHEGGTGWIRISLDPLLTGTMTIHGGSCYRESHVWESSGGRTATETKECSSANGNIVIGTSGGKTFADLEFNGDTAGYIEFSFSSDPQPSVFTVDASITY